MAGFNLQVVTPDGIAYEGECTSISFRATDGDVCIQKDHCDYISTINVSEVKIENGSDVRYAACSAGFFSITKNEATLVSTTFEFSENIDIERAKLAKQKAEKMLSEKTDAEHQKLLKAKLFRALVRISVANK